MAGNIIQSSLRAEKCAHLPTDDPVSVTAARRRAPPVEEAGPGLREVEYLAHVHGRKMTELRMEILFYL